MCNIINLQNYKDAKFLESYSEQIDDSMHQLKELIEYYITEKVGLMLNTMTFGEAEKYFVTEESELDIMSKVATYCILKTLTNRELLTKIPSIDFIQTLDSYTVEMIIKAMNNLEKLLKLTDEEMLEDTEL